LYSTGEIQGFKLLTLPLNSSEMGDPNLVFLLNKIFRQTKI